MVRCVNELRHVVTAGEIAPAWVVLVPDYIDIFIRPSILVRERTRRHDHDARITATPAEQHAAVSYGALHLVTRPFEVREPDEAGSGGFCGEPLQGLRCRLFKQ